MSGRKKKTLPPPKKHRITIRLTEDEYVVLKKECELSQLSVSEYIRRLLLHRKIPIYPIVIHDDRELIEELHKINKVGNNLNQIARYLNQGGVLTNPLAKQKYQSEQEEIDEKIKAIRLELNTEKQTAEDARKWIELIKKNTDPTELTADLLNTLIEKIVVHDAAEDEFGFRTQEIEIYYRFVGKIDE